MVPRADKLRRGFGILEVLIAILIFSLVLFTILSTFITLAEINLKNHLRNLAVTIVEKELENVRALGYKEVTNSLNKGNNSCREAISSGKNVETFVLGNKKYRFGKFYLIDDNSALKLKKVKVEVCWSLKGKLYSVNGTTIVR